MAEYHPLEAYRGEDVSLVVTLDESAAGWALAFDVYASRDSTTSLVSRTTAAGISVSTVTVTVTLTSNNLNLAAGSYHYRLCRTDSGARAMLTEGPLTILGPTAG